MVSAYLVALHSLHKEHVTTCVPVTHNGTPDILTTSFPIIPTTKHCIYAVSPYERACFHIGVAQAARQYAQAQGMELTG